MPQDLNDEDVQKAAILRARHEALNGRLKRFYVLTDTFRNDVCKHSSCFRAVLNITQLTHEHEPSFFVQFYTKAICFCIVKHSRSNLLIISISRSSLIFY